MNYVEVYLNEDGLNTKKKEKIKMKHGCKKT